MSKLTRRSFLEVVRNAAAMLSATDPQELAKAAETMAAGAARIAKEAVLPIIETTPSLPTAARGMFDFTAARQSFYSSLGKTGSGTLEATAKTVDALPNTIPSILRMREAEAAYKEALGRESASANNSLSLADGLVVISQEMERLATMQKTMEDNCIKAGIDFSGMASGFEILQSSFRVQREELAARCQLSGATALELESISERSHDYGSEPILTNAQTPYLHTITLNVSCAIGDLKRFISQGANSSKIASVIDALSRNMAEIGNALGVDMRDAAHEMVVPGFKYKREILGEDLDKLKKTFWKREIPAWTKDAIPPEITDRVLRRSAGDMIDLAKTIKGSAKEGLDAKNLLERLAEMEKADQPHSLTGADYAHHMKNKLDSWTAEETIRRAPSPDEPRR